MAAVRTSRQADATAIRRISWEKTVRSLLGRIRGRAARTGAEGRYDYDTERIQSKVLINSMETSRADSSTITSTTTAVEEDDDHDNDKSTADISFIEEEETIATSLPPMLPTVQRALVVARKGEYEIRNDFPMPTVGDDEIMIRSRYVGLNPIDWKSVDYNFCLPEFPWVTGREMSGVVAHVGSSVTSFKKSDVVWTSTYYKDMRAGCFQEYVVVPSHTVLPIPSTVSFEAAACLGVAALTAAMTLWKWLAVPIPSASDERINHVKENGEEEQGKNEPEWLLIWGGSTVTGQFTTQLARLSGLSVITVTSAETRVLSEALGANHVVVRDGRTDQELVQEISNVTKGRITRAIDLVGPKTAALVLDAVSKEAPVVFAPLAMMSSSQTVPGNVTVHTVEMKQFVLDKSNVCYTEELGRLLESEKIDLPELYIVEGGLDVIQEGLEMLKKGNMKGKKLVVRM